MDYHDGEELIEKEIARRESAIRDLCTLRNTHAGISKPPIEVLGEIFVLTKSLYDQDTRENGGRLNVAGVCRNWRETALNAPRMWDTFDAAKIRNCDWIETILARSKTAPLHVKCTHPHPHMDRVEFILVLMNMARVQDLELSLETYRYPRIEEFLMARTAPLLQSLRLNSEDDSYNSTECRGIYGFLNGVLMPRLHTMDVRLSALPPTIPMLPQLRRLTYVPPIAGSVLGATMSSMLSFLRSAPSLERLEISGNFRTPDDEGLEERTMTELPELSFRALSSVPPSGQHRTSHLEPILTRMESSDFVATIEVVSFVAMNDTYFSMLATSPDGLAALFRLCVALPSSNAHTLRICGFSSMMAADWAGLFGRDEQVRELTADKVDGNFLRALLRSSGTGRPPFMRLKRLTLMHCDIEQGPTIVEQIVEEHRILDSPVDV